MNADLLWIAAIVALAVVGVYFAAKAVHLGDTLAYGDEEPRRDWRDLIADVYPNGLPMPPVLGVCGHAYCNDYHCPTPGPHRHCHECEVPA